MTDISREDRADSILRVDRLSPAAIKVREHILTDNEIQELFKCDGTVALALQWQLLHGCRVSEVLGLKWNEIDFEARTWTLPASRIKTQKKNSANQKNHTLPLTDQAIEFLLWPGERKPDSLIFQNSWGRKISANNVDYWTV
ncbi:MAG: tyrosine-type recombinase/integrase [gamma proteobacterium symbiont of Lucinoma myriamae]|nr:tyrosine-type recombinase/integrase [gamma proteobacterium symbiont of Lucinoma myriamae]